MEQVHDPEPAAAAAPGFPLGVVLDIFAHIIVFAGFGGCLALVSGLKEVYDDAGKAELVGHTPAVMALNNSFESIHIPLWALAVLGLAVDLLVWRALRRKYGLRAANIWAWLVGAGVVLASAIVVVSAFLPLIGDIESFR